MSDIEPKGVRGSSLRLADLFAEGHKREGLRLLRQAIEYGWVDGFWIDYQEAKQEARKLLKDDDSRVRLGAVRTLATMAAHDLKLIEMMDSDGTPAGGVNVNVNVIQVAPSATRNI